MKTFITFLLVLCLHLSTANAQSSSTNIDLIERGTETVDTVHALERPFNYIDGLVLGAIEGITEFLPISSTGHLIVANHLLKLDHNNVLQDHNGEALFVKNEKGEVTVYTYKTAIDAYIVIIQLGAIAVILLLYWNRFVVMFKGVFRRKKDKTASENTEPLDEEIALNNGKSLALNLIVAFLPAAFLGLLVHQWVMEHLFNMTTVIISLLSGAVIMIIAENRREKILEGEYESAETMPEVNLKIEDLTMMQAFKIGVLQCLALIPGMSRSMITIVGGYWMGLNPLAAVEFSFLLGFVTLCAASCYEILKEGRTMLEVFDFGPLLFGLFVAFISGIFVIRWFIGYIGKKGIKLFAYYRIGLAALIGLLLLLK